MTNVSRTNRNGLRPRSDLYQTPPGDTAPFVVFERRALRRACRCGKIWECAAGKGAIARVLRAYGFKTVESDLLLHKRRGDASPVEKLNIFDAKKRRGPVVITNPPFKIVDAFVRHVLKLRPRYAAFFLPITFLAGIARRDLRDGIVGGLKLARVLFLSWRTTLKPEGVVLKNSGVVAYAWFIWIRGHKGPWTGHSLYRATSA